MKDETFDVAAVSSDESFVARENKRDGDGDGDGDAKTRFVFFLLRVSITNADLYVLFFFSLLRGCSQSP